MKFNWKTEILPLACIVVMFILAAIAWPQAPERIPTHWGITGEPDGYGGKFMGLLGIPLTALGMYVLLYFLPRFDPRRENYQKFWGKYLFFRLIILLLFTCIQTVIFLWIIGVNFNMSLAIFMFVGFMFLLIGNYLGKLRPTWFVGIRSPWTLSSEESWNKTHRLGGRLFMIFGLGMIITAPFRENAAYYALFAVGGVFLVFLYVYSYLIWKKDPNAAPVGTRITDHKSNGE